MENIMFTVAMTLIGIIVFVISLFGAGLKAGVKRLGVFVILGIVLDVITFVTIAAVTYLSL
jgi:hypothetical protein